MNVIRDDQNEMERTQLQIVVVIHPHQRTAPQAPASGGGCFYIVLLSFPLFALRIFFK
jgi:hypothetical protein